MQVKIISQNNKNEADFQHAINSALTDLNQKGRRIIDIKPCYTSTTVVYREVLILHEGVVN